MYGRTDDRKDGRTVGQTNGRTDGRTHGQTNERTDERAVGRTDARTDGRTWRTDERAVTIIHHWHSVCEKLAVLDVLAHGGNNGVTCGTISV